MKKVAVIFIAAVLGPSIVLAWLALRSVRDQQYLLQHQQALFYQGVADALAKQTQDDVTERLREFGMQVEALLADHLPRDAAVRFDDQLRRRWPWAEVGFVVTLDGTVLAPTLLSRGEARRFRLENDQFLSNRGAVEVYWNNPKNAVSFSPGEENRDDFKMNFAQKGEPYAQQQALASAEQTAGIPDVQSVNPTANLWAQNYARGGFAGKGQNIQRKVIPQSEPQPEANMLSKIAVAEAEFRQLIGEATEGMVARFLQNQLKLLIWYRSARDPQLVFGAQLDLPRLVQKFQRLVQLDAALHQEICVALLDDNGKPVARSHSQFQADWKRPFVATEIGEMLPHWELGVYLLDPAKLSQSAQTLKFTLGLIILTMVLAIGVGGWLIVADLRRELTLARQKTDFVSNVSHELKTPLTSIRMFSELLAEDRVTDEAKRYTYLNIIAAEAGRLTRLINNVLDFARLERGEKKYHFQNCELVSLVQETVDLFRPHLEAKGFQLNCELPEPPLCARADRDALAQVVVNLLSNAEKYSGEGKEIQVRVQARTDVLPHIEIEVADRGLGVPPGCETKIFEKFFRAHDSLASGIPGSGLGLTLARQIARAHGGDVVYQAREGGGSRFALRLPRIGEVGGVVE